MPLALHVGPVETAGACLVEARGGLALSRHTPRVPSSTGLQPDPSRTMRGDGGSHGGGGEAPSRRPSRTYRRRGAQPRCIRRARQNLKRAELGAHVAQCVGCGGSGISCQFTIMSHNMGCDNTAWTRVPRRSPHAHEKGRTDGGNGKLINMAHSGHQGRSRNVLRTAPRGRLLVLSQMHPTRRGGEVPSCLVRPLFFFFFFFLFFFSFCFFFSFFVFFFLFVSSSFSLFPYFFLSRRRRARSPRPAPPRRRLRPRR